MKPEIHKASSQHEFFTAERLFITEIWNSATDNDVSIARARVEPGVTTALHYLDGVDERYIIISGKGIVEVQGLTPTKVATGDIIEIPANKTQRITNVDESDLIFYCICTPRFTPDCYCDVETE